MDINLPFNQKIMKYFEFLRMSPNEILSYLSNKGINKVQDIMSVKEFIYKSGLSEIPENSISIDIHNRSMSKGSIVLSFKNKIEDIEFWVAFNFYNVYKSHSNIKLSIYRIEFDKHGSTFMPQVCVFKKITPFFDLRPEYNNIELYYIVKDTTKNLKLSEYYDEILKYRKDINPILQELLSMIEDGRYEKLFNKWNVREFKKGHEPLNIFSFNNIITRLYLKKFDNIEDIFVYDSFCDNILLSPNIDQYDYFIKNKEECKKMLMKHINEKKSNKQKIESLSSDLKKFLESHCEEYGIQLSEFSFGVKYHNELKRIDWK